MVPDNPNTVDPSTASIGNSAGNQEETTREPIAESDSPLFTSPYAPLNPSGPLPPGLSAEVVKRAFRKYHLPPKSVLSLLGIRTYGPSPEKQLRRALDDPAYRARLFEPEVARRVPPLHIALYHDLTASVHGPGVYQRAIKHAEEPMTDAQGQESRLHLNASVFASIIANEFVGTGLDLPHIEPFTELEAFAQYALAFALLEPESASQLLQPLLAHSAGCREYFGASAHDGHELGLSSSGSRPADTNDRQSASSTVATETTSEARAQVSEGRTVQPELDPPAGHPRSALGEHAGLSSSSEDARSPHVRTSPDARLGPREAALRSLQMQLGQSSEERRTLGAAARLDLHAFEKAQESEARLQQAIVMLEREHAQALTLARSRLTRALSSCFTDHAMHFHNLLGSQSIARWLDDNEESVGIAEHLASDIAVQQRLLATTGVVQSGDGDPPIIRTVSEALSNLTQRGELLTRMIAKVADWEHDLEALRQTHFDCAEARPAPSIAKADVSSIRRLIGHARRDARLRNVLPLLLRWLAECSSWRVVGAPDEDCTLLEAVLQDIAIQGDHEQHIDILSSLDPLLLQALLRSGRQVLSRHVVLIAFSATLLSRQPAFFVWIWPFASWQGNDVFGGCLTGLFGALQQHFANSNSVPLIVASLRHSDASQGATAALTAERKQAAEDLANRLVSIPGTGGFYHRLRRCEVKLIGRPLFDQLRHRRVKGVRHALAGLEARDRSGRLEEDILDEYGDARELEHTHHERLRRDVESHLTAIREWVEEEERLTGATSTVTEDTVVRSIHEHIASLDASHRDGAVETRDVGSIKWLEHEVAASVAAALATSVASPPAIHFGEVAPAETLFAASGANDQPNGASGLLPLWPDWFHRDARSVRLWHCYTSGSRPTWSDALQDALAERLLPGDRTLEGALCALVRAGFFDAVIAAGRRTDPPLDPACLSIVEEASRSLAQRKSLEGRLFDFDSRLRRLLSSAHQELIRGQLLGLDADLLSALGDVEDGRYEDAKSRLAAIEIGLETIGQAVASAEAEAAQRETSRKEAIAWLVVAGRPETEQLSLAAALQLQADIRESERPRRAHLHRLSELDGPATPEPLRSALRQWAAGADHPSRWPTRERAREVADHIEVMSGTCRDWWATYRATDNTEPVHELLTRLLQLFTTKLPQELDSLLQGDEPHAPLLAMFIECRGGVTVQQYYRLIRDRQLEDSASSSTPSIHDHVRDDGAGHLVAAVLQRVQSRFPTPAFVMGVGSDVADAFAYFGKADYDRTCTLALQARAWATSVGKSDLVGALTAIHAWSAHLLHPEADKRAAVDALGLLIHFHDLIIARSAVPPEIILEWLLGLFHPSAPPTSDAKGKLLVDLLDAVAVAEPGTPDRENLRTILRIGDAPYLARVLWTAIPSSGRIARASLLVFLFDLGDGPALRHLFDDAGDTGKYLWAFSQLATRARLDPSPARTSAVRQSAQTIAQQSPSKPFQEFTRRLLARLKYEAATVHVSLVSDTLERDPTANVYRLAVAIRPEDADPPLSLAIELEDTDFRLAPGAQRRVVVADNEPLLYPVEIEFLLRPHGTSASSVALRVTGETVGAQALNLTFTFLVTLSSDAGFESIPVAELLDIYEGIDSKPVTGDAFIGRDDELAALHRAVSESNPGAAILYGTRRLGKTSLLTVLRNCDCTTARPASQTLFIMIPVDEFQIGHDATAFLALFAKHLWRAILFDMKNAPLRDLLASTGTNMRALQEMGKLDEAYVDAPFISVIRELLRRLREACCGRVSTVVLVFDEFDKLLEAYRKGLEPQVQELLNQLRRAALEDPSIGVILAGSDLMKVILLEYRSAMYGSAAVVPLTCFDTPAQRVDAERVIRPLRLSQRRRFPQHVVDAIVTITGGHPYYLRLLSCAACFVSTRQVVSVGTVHQAVRNLLRNEILRDAGLPDPLNLVLGPLQALAYLESEDDELLGWLLLLQLAHVTALERPFAPWQALGQDDTLVQLRSPVVWARVRDTLAGAGILRMSDDKRWGFRFPLIAEALRLKYDVDFEARRNQLLARFPQSPRP